MICSPCALAADYGRQDLHKNCEHCDCHHQPIQGEPRLVGEADVELSPAEKVGLIERCNYCDKLIKVRNDGQLRKHGTVTIDGVRKLCSGSGS